MKNSKLILAAILFSTFFVACTADNPQDERDAIAAQEIQATGEDSSPTPDDEREGDGD